MTGNRTEQAGRTLTLPANAGKSFGYVRMRPLAGILTVYTCRECERPINQAAEVCPYCGADLTVTPESEEPPKKRNLVSVLLRWGVLVAAMWGFLWFVLPQSGDPQQRAEAHALEALRECQTTLAAYADAQGGRFPPSLEALPPDSTVALRGAAQRALAEGYRIEYTPGALNPDGRVTSYSLRLNAGHFGFPNFFADQSGVVRSTKEKRPATVEDPPI